MELDQQLREIKDKIGSIGTQQAVLTMFCMTLIHTLHPEHRDSVEASLRSGLNRMLELGDDDRPLAAHQNEALAVANVFFAEFERQRRASASRDDDAQA
jgi:hypothetical protein